MKVLILGGDGYLGWPTAMHLSQYGHEVRVVDNYLRRRVCMEEDVPALYPVPNLHERAKIWKGISGKTIDVQIGNLSDWDFCSSIFEDYVPDTVIHYAEQPSAPYSMLGRRQADLTLNNNIKVTGNVIFAVREYCPKAHIVKLGTMGEYGTPNIDIEEGWLDINHKGRTQRFLYPRQASSLYHTTKVMDTDLLWFYVRTWGLRVTDLMQGPVYGIFTDESEGDERLLPFFNYDELFGTAVNRFVVQAAAGVPLTVYGKGGQTRGYLDIRDTLSCVRLCAENAPEEGELRIFNQFVETFSVNDLASRVKESGKRLGIEVQVNNIENPRKEAEEHYYNPAHSGLLELGLTPHCLTDDFLDNLLGYIVSKKNMIRKDAIFRNVKWA